MVAAFAHLRMPYAALRTLAKYGRVCDAPYFAEDVGFEPTDSFTRRRFSKPLI